MARNILLGEERRGQTEDGQELGDVGGPVRSGDGAARGDDLVAHEVGRVPEGRVQEELQERDEVLGAQQWCERLETLGHAAACRPRRARVKLRAESEVGEGERERERESR